MLATVVLDELDWVLMSTEDPDRTDPGAEMRSGGLGSAVSGRDAEAHRLAELLVRTAASDSAAFADLYDGTSSRVYGMVLRVLRDPGYAEETTQDVYLHVWRSASSFDPDKGSALSWLMMLAHRRAVDRVRSEQSHSTREGVYGMRNQTREFDDVSDEVWRRFERQSVLDCLDSLTETQRESVALAYYGGRTYRDVAAHLEVGLPTVKSRIRDGLIRLKNCLGVQ